MTNSDLYCLLGSCCWSYKDLTHSMCEIQNRIESTWHLIVSHDRLVLNYFLGHLHPAFWSLHFFFLEAALNLRTLLRGPWFWTPLQFEFECEASDGTEGETGRGTEHNVDVGQWGWKRNKWKPTDIRRLLGGTQGWRVDDGNDGRSWISFCFFVVNFFLSQR